MAAAATTLTRSPLEDALCEVHAVLAELIVAADAHYAAVAGQDCGRIEQVTREQERLSARLARAERQRLALLGGRSLSEAISTLPAIEAARLEALRASIATTVQDLRECQAKTARLLARSIELGKQTLELLQRLVTVPGPVYSGRGVVAPRQSVLVDGRA
jgi:flagellar biosynthesis/type III secretory pathway chaperone